MRQKRTNTGNNYRRQLMEHNKFKQILCTAGSCVLNISLISLLSKHSLSTKRHIWWTTVFLTLCLWSIKPNLYAGCFFANTALCMCHYHYCIITWLWVKNLLLFHAAMFVQDTVSDFATSFSWCIANLPWQMLCKCLLDYSQHECFPTSANPELFV